MDVSPKSDSNAFESKHRQKTCTIPKQRQPEKGIRQNYELNKFERRNDSLFAFYKKQRIVPDTEWDHFCEILATELPSSFRIQRSLPEKDCLANFLEQHFFKQIASIAATSESDGVGIHPPKSVPFVPYAYQTKMPRSMLRRHPILKEFHEFLVNETELGNMSRQETCSMVPPLLLDVQPHHRVLDACAAPGSKTMQIIELMHEHCPNPEGFVLANDSDYKRCYLLVRQTLKRMPTANVAVVSHDASQLPALLDANDRPMLFDRILCDLICSGDGTLRKNPELWRSWDPLKSVNLHKLQLQIARRCLELLANDGLMVYSTCSLNPLEDEAVIAQLLRKSNGTAELVDISDRLKELKRMPGISEWKVFDKEMNEVRAVDDVRAESRRLFKPSMFPPTLEEASQMHLERCFRILPHLHDSGGFFVALLRKKGPKSENDFQRQIDGTNAQMTIGPFSFRKSTAKRARFSNKEDPFIFLEENGQRDDRFVSELDTHFGISPSEFPHSNLLVRSHNTERKKEIYFVNDAIRDFLRFNAKRFRIVNAGVGVLKRIVSDKVAQCPYRLKQDGLRTLLPFITKKILDIPMDVLIKILKGQPNKDNSSQYLPLTELGDQKTLFEDISVGSLLLRFQNDFIGVKILCAWKGQNSISAFVSREQKIHLLCLFGENISKLMESKDNTSRREKGRQMIKNGEEDKGTTKNNAENGEEEMRNE
ncbi:hypothetical protein niasHT_015838 [Heterodera trifolii]|uniref:tRNA (cytosine(34)-C(5))-methyltransferase n=1 Tax=Heterodera trifolii TaxID=157864 RepID=A0ABD2L4T4_9BILA